ncbi:MAG TPA: GNAT family N-acetyltransferase [Anaerolineales bacterium]|nr:GNAT family N-acetyltransferase [Anaerolineales bacterium]
MNIKTDALEIIHNPAESRFEIWIEGKLSKLDYVEDENSISMTHVGVHPDHRGQGVAGKLTEAAFEYARKKSLRAIPVCPYVITFLRRNPQYAELTKPK